MKIVTVTLNPSLDKFLYVNELKVGRVNRISQLLLDIGGKGLNVSLGLKAMKEDSIAIGFFGGEIGEELVSMLKNRDIKTKPIYIKESTRTNYKILDESDRVLTECNEPGPHITNEEYEEFIKLIDKYADEDTWFVFGGSGAKGMDHDIYRQLIVRVKVKNAHVILDADGELLKEGIKAIPDIIKPNQHEMEGLVGHELNSIEEQKQACISILNRGVKLVVLSLGSKGAMFVTKDEAIFSPVLDIEVKSTLGAGDSMVAGVVKGLSNGKSLEETVRYATACSSAAVMTEGTCFGSYEQI